MGFTSKSKVISKVTEYFWKYSVTYTLYCFQGNNTDSQVVLSTRKGDVELITLNEATPYPKLNVVPPLDVNMTWCLAQLSKDEHQLNFSIDRKKSTCLTPRRNDSIHAAMTFFNNFSQWAHKVENYFHNHLFQVEFVHCQNNGAPNLNTSVTQRGSEIFVPVIPLFEVPEKLKLLDDGKEIPGASTGSLILPMDTVGSFLVEQKRGLGEKYVEITKIFPSATKGRVISAVEGKIIILCNYIQIVIDHYFNSVNFIEDMLFKQLFQAIGKEVTSADFGVYMKYHNRKLFRDEYLPRPFSYAVSRPGFSPEGTVSIEMVPTSGEAIMPIQTCVAGFKAKKPFYFPLNAASNVSFYGDRFVHGWVQHSFAGDTQAPVRINARARAFSCYFLLLGRIVANDVFDPKYAMILKNKDDMTIPLVLETIPTAAEFAEAVESMSPEQQRFSKAYRGMQLSSTLFGVLILQIKPQLERLLNLPSDSLTKELRMTQDLLQLFNEFAIPGDLLSYNGDPKASVDVKLDYVRKQVNAMRGMIEDAKKEDEALQRAKTAYVAPLTPSESEDCWDDDEECLPTCQIMEEYDRLENCMAMECEAIMDYDEMPKSKSKSDKKEKSEAPLKRMKDKESKDMKKMEPATDSKMRKKSAKQEETKNSKETNSSKKDSISNKKDDSSSKPKDTDGEKPKDSEKPKEDEKPKEGEKPKDEPDLDGKLVAPGEEVGEDIDVTQIPGRLDSQCLALDTDNSLRPTIINIGEVWNKSSQIALLSPSPIKTELNADLQLAEKNKAFDLLDALTRSGCLPFLDAALHVVIASTYCFQKTLVNTVIQQNQNPIEKLERSTLIVTTTIHDQPASQLVNPNQLERLTEFSPSLFVEPKKKSNKSKVKKLKLTGVV
jgi:hypothetical protein